MMERVLAMAKCLEYYEVSCQDGSGDHPDKKMLGKRIKNAILKRKLM